MVHVLLVEYLAVRWNWIGHTLRGERSSDCMVALGWRPGGKRAVSTPKTTWRRTVEVERRQAGWNDWSTVKAAAGTGWHGSRMLRPYRPYS